MTVLAQIVLHLAAVIVNRLHSAEQPVFDSRLILVGAHSGRLPPVLVVPHHFPDAAERLEVIRVLVAPWMISKPPPAAAFLEVRVSEFQHGTHFGHHPHHNILPGGHQDPVPVVSILHTDERELVESAFEDIWSPRSHEIAVLDVSVLDDAEHPVYGEEPHHCHLSTNRRCHSSADSALSSMRWHAAGLPQSWLRSLPRW